MPNEGSALGTRLSVLILLFTVTFSTHAADTFDHQQWDNLTSTHVNTINHGVASQVNYQGFLAHRKQLKQYLAQLEGISKKTFDSWNNNDQLAFLLNAYNAWTVELILSKYPHIKSIKDLGSFFQSPWKKSFIPLLGKERSLDDIEHSLIRGSDRYNEPRIHFAANCASVGCPALRAEAFTGDKLESQLEDSTRSFLKDRSRNRLNNNDLEVSSIFKWYRDDFEKNWRGKKNLAQFLASYNDAIGLNQQQAQQLTQGDIDIEFLDYDWHLNDTQQGITQP